MSVRAKINMGNRKYFINREREEKECGNCREIKSFKEFSFQSSNHRVLQTYCKPCRSRIRSLKKAIERAERSSLAYMECSNELCGNVWLKARGSFCSVCGLKGKSYEKTMIKNGES